MSISRNMFRRQFRKTKQPEPSQPAPTGAALLSQDDRCLLVIDDPRGGSIALPGEFPYHPFRSPFSPETAVTSDEFRDKYLFGDWCTYRSKLAARGIKPTLLLIVDPFGSVKGGLRRGAQQLRSAWPRSCRGHWAALCASRRAVSRWLCSQFRDQSLGALCGQQLSHSARRRGRNPTAAHLPL